MLSVYFGDLGVVFYVGDRDQTFFVVFAGVDAVRVASDMAIDFRFHLLTGEDTEIATGMQGQPKGLQGKGKV
ncbi:hypothetical protein D4764_07G0004770 [Takifugu flavidus]|uniref:Uncharacterized protein n=1 Tax=Takifugu flavidus TaxID=433684 RepID=A0A5C6MTV9_9TELE|nr:hypothetical protein D4764_07G0004770 [Takifugu flavidus]